MKYFLIFILLIFFVRLNAQDSAYARKNSIRVQTAVKYYYRDFHLIGVMQDSAVTWFRKNGLTDSIIHYKKGGIISSAERYFYSNNDHDSRKVYTDSLSTQTQVLQQRFDLAGRCTVKLSILDGDTFQIVKYEYGKSSQPIRKTEQYFRYSFTATIDSFSDDSLHSLLSHEVIGAAHRITTHEVYKYSYRKDGQPLFFSSTDMNGAVIRSDCYHYNHRGDMTRYKTVQNTYFTTVYDKYNKQHVRIYMKVSTPTYCGITHYYYVYNPDSSYAMTSIIDYADDPAHPKKFKRSKSVAYCDRDGHSMGFVRYNDSLVSETEMMMPDRRSNEYYFYANGDTLNSKVNTYYPNGLLSAYSEKQYSELIYPGNLKVHMLSTASVTRYTYEFYEP